MLITKIGESNIVSKYNNSQQINKRISFKESDDRISQPDEEQKSDKNLLVALGLTATAILVFAFRKPIGKFLGLSKNISSDFIKFDDKLIKKMEKKKSGNLKNSIIYVEKEMMQVELSNKGADIKGKIMLLSDKAKEHCGIAKEDIGIALGYTINGGEPTFTKLASCKELLGIESFKALGKDGVITLP